MEVLPQESKEWIGRGERRKIDRGIEIESALQNVFWSRRMSNEARRLNFVRVPKIPMRRIHEANTTQTRKHWRSFLRTSIDRGVHIDRIGVEKSIFEQRRKQRRVA